MEQSDLSREKFENPAQIPYFIRLNLKATDAKSQKNYLMTFREVRSALEVTYNDKVGEGETLAQALKRILKETLNLEGFIRCEIYSRVEFAKDRFGNVLPRYILDVTIPFISDVRFNWPGFSSAWKETYPSLEKVPLSAQAEKSGFHAFAVQQSPEPVTHLNNLLQSAINRLPSTQDPVTKQRTETEIKNLQDFLNLVDDNSMDRPIGYLEKSNKGEAALGTSAVLFQIMKRPSQEASEEIKERIINFLQAEEKNPSDKSIFLETRIPGIYIWWEKGEERTESIGKFVDRTLKGFVKIST